MLNAMQGTLPKLSHPSRKLSSILPAMEFLGLPSRVHLTMVGKKRHSIHALGISPRPFPSCNEINIPYTPSPLPPSIASERPENGSSVLSSAHV
jgi:hypothetical protein